MKHRESRENGKTTFPIIETLQNADNLIKSYDLNYSNDFDDKCNSNQPVWCVCVCVVFLVRALHLRSNEKLRKTQKNAASFS